MPKFEDYQFKYETIRLEREDGLLTMTFHTGGESLRWGATAQKNALMAFRDIAGDPYNLVIIMTGTGSEFSGTRGFKWGAPGQAGSDSPRPATKERRVPGDAAINLLPNLLSIQVPIIAAINGPAWRHAEIPLLSDIVLASENAAFQDSAHFINGLPPGDGQHVLLPMAIGINRARYYLLTGQVLSARDAERYGLVNEVLPADQLIPRANDLATALLRQSPTVLRNSRRILTEQIRRNMSEYLDYGHALERLGSPAHEG